MDSLDKDLLVFGSFVTVLILAGMALFAYDAQLRAEAIATAPDPLYAACAYDSGGLSVPPSCYTLLSLNKDLPR